MLNRGFAYTERIGPRGDGIAILDYLAERYTHSSPVEWVAHLHKGLVRLDGRAAAPWDVLCKGQTLVWLRPPWEEPEVPLAFAVLYRDSDLLAVAKPSGLPTMPAGGYLDHTLLTLVRRHYPEASAAHRLGRGTSGVVLFTRTREASAQVLAAWRDHRVDKVYRALVQGHPPADTFACETPIGPMAHPALGTVFAANPEGKRALSRARVLERREGCSLVEVAIETGRPHQIRIHMAACGHPLVGDPLYAAGGGWVGDGLALPGDEGYRLHALRLSLAHPRSGLPLQVECAAPPILTPC